MLIIVLSVAPLSLFNCSTILCLYNLMQRQLPSTPRYEKSIHITTHSKSSCCDTFQCGIHKTQTHSRIHTHTHTLSRGGGGAACTLSLIAKYKLFTKTSSDSLHLESDCSGGVSCNGCPLGATLAEISASSHVV